MKLVIEADGGSRGNPGIAGSGTVIYEADGTTVVRKLAYVVGTATNNVAEYHALYNGLCVAQQLGATDISVRMDSKLVVEQMSGRWKIRHAGTCPQMPKNPPHSALCRIHLGAPQTERRRRRPR